MYLQKFPEVFSVKEISKRRDDKAMRLEEVFPDLAKTDYYAAVQKVECILNFVKDLPSSKLEFEEIGMDTLNAKTIEKLRVHTEYIQKAYEPINLQADVKGDNIHISQAF